MKNILILFLLSCVWLQASSDRSPRKIGAAAIERRRQKRETDKVYFELSQKTYNMVGATLCQKVESLSTKWTELSVEEQFLIMQWGLKSRLKFLYRIPSRDLDYLEEVVVDSPAKYFLKHDGQAIALRSDLLEVDEIKECMQRFQKIKTELTTRNLKEQIIVLNMKKKYLHNLIDIHNKHSDSNQQIEYIK